MSDLEDRVRELYAKVDKLNDEIGSLKEQISGLVAKVDVLTQQNEKAYNLLKWIIYILLGMVGVIVGLKVTPPS
jgi:regulator of replication initiation timing